MSRSIGALIRAAHEAGIEVRNTPRGLRLVVRTAVPPELLVELRERRGEIEAELQAHARPGPDPAVPLMHGGGR
jgi:hypothetical protein